MGAKILTIRPVSFLGDRRIKHRYVTQSKMVQPATVIQSISLEENPMIRFSKGEQHSPAFHAINPNGKVPAIVDTEGPELLSWLFFIGTGLGPFSGQAVHFQYAAPESNSYASNRYRREAERHYRVLDKHLAGREYIVGNDYSIVDISAWGWVDRASRVMKGEAEPLAAFPNIRRWFQAIDARPAAVRARAVGKNHEFKRVNDEETQRALFPSNYPLLA